MNAAVWKGNTVGVNKWHGVMQQKIKGKNGRMTTKGVIYKKPEYRRFVRSLAIAFKQQLTPVTGYVQIDIVMWLAQSKDTDGPFKPIFDALQMAGIIQNDNLNHKGSYDRYDSTDKFDTIAISVKELVREDPTEHAVH